MVSQVDVQINTMEREYRSYQKVFNANGSHGYKKKKKKIYRELPNETYNDIYN